MKIYIFLNFFYRSFRDYIHDIGKCSFSYSTFFRLIRSNILLDAYPLHDGNYEFTVSGPLNDRQVAKYTLFFV